MSEMKSAVGAGMDRSGNDLCVENSVHEFKIWADVLNYGKKILKKRADKGEEDTKVQKR